jgi:hypothetical protein
MIDYGKATSGTQAGEMEIFGQSNQSSPVKQTTYLGRYDKRTVTMAGLFIFGALCICVVRIIGQPQLAAGQSAVDKSADGVVGLLSGGTNPWLSDDRAREAIDNLLKGTSNALVPTISPRGNPFVLEPTNQTPSTQPTHAATDDPKARELERMTEVAGNLQLESILLGDDGPTAVVSGKLVKEGQVVEGWCVREIHPQKVVLVWEGHTFTLSIR